MVDRYENVQIKTYKVEGNTYMRYEGDCMMDITKYRYIIPKINISELVKEIREIGDGNNTFDIKLRVEPDERNTLCEYIPKD